MSNVRRHELFVELALKMKRRCLLVALPSLLTSCSRDDEGQEVTWGSLKVATIELELIDSEKFEHFGFTPDGAVLATIGLRDGPVAGPLFYWRIENNHLVISAKPNSDTYADFHSPRKSGEFLLVRRGIFGKSKFRVKHRDA
jgi:hypothetical protein